METGKTQAVGASAIAAYRDRYGAGAPDAGQWQRLADWPDGSPVHIVNFFKFHGTAEYADEPGADVSGQEAFSLYSEVSIPAVAKAGGHFLLVGPFAGAFVGAEQDWDLVAIAHYPDKQSVFALFDNPAYRQAYRHRIAACASQSVTLVSA